MQGRLSISLDFELHWGRFDKSPIAAYRDNLLGVRRAAPALLALFREYEIHATWAIVGSLFAQDRDELEAFAPQHVHPALAAYDAFSSLGADEVEDPFHYAPSLVRLIAQTPGQEIATHTFSHCCVLAPGVTPAMFEEELQAAKGLAAHKGIELHSVVFPRNQYNPEALSILRRVGFSCYRSNQRAWMYSALPDKAQNRPIRRAARLADAYIPVSGLNGHEVHEHKGLWEVPASRFLRPYHRALRHLEPTRFARIAAEMTYAAIRGKLYHLWWHPHNFGTHLSENMAFLRRILGLFAALRSRFSMQSVSMLESTQP